MLQIVNIQLNLKFMKKKSSILLFLILIGLLPAKAQVYFGIDVLEERDFDILKGKRVGLVTNATGVNSELRSSVDVLNDAPDVELVALFGPEHGVRGDIVADGSIANSKDSRTGLTIYSLYGSTYKPTAAMLKGIDVLVYDIQDIGCRSYTFISTMGKCLEACAEHDIEFVVLDRPNPLGGEKVEGALVSPGYSSFVSQYPIPYIYGLTAGELATYLNEEGLLAVKKKVRLTVVPCEGWRRDMIWEDTGLKWVPTSPNIPQPVTALFYPASGICGEMQWLSIGIGTSLPFQLFGASWIDAEKLCDRLNFMNIPGFEFRAATFRPRYGLGNGKVMQGVQPYITDYDRADLTLLQFYVMEAVSELYPAQAAFKADATQKKIGTIDRVCGSKDLRLKFIEGGRKVSAIYDYWMKPALEFKKKSKKYYLYD